MDNLDYNDQTGHDSVPAQPEPTGNENNNKTPELNKEMLHHATNPNKIGIYSSGRLSSDILKNIQENYLKLFKKYPFTVSFESFQDVVASVRTIRDAEAKRNENRHKVIVSDEAANRSTGTEDIFGDDEEYMFEPDEGNDLANLPEDAYDEPQEYQQQQDLPEDIEDSKSIKTLTFRERAHQLLYELKKKLGLIKPHQHKTTTEEEHGENVSDMELLEPGEEIIEGSFEVPEQTHKSEEELAVSEKRPSIDTAEILKDNDILFIFTCLDDVNEIENTFFLLELAKKNELLSIVIASLPRYFGKVENVHSMNRTLQKLRLTGELVLLLPYFETIDFKLIPNLLQELLELITEPGLINLDIADLKIIVKGGNVGVITFGTGRHTTKAKDAFFETLDSKLLNVELPGVKKALLNITGGKDMTLAEVEGIADQFKRRMEPDAQFILGARINPELKDRIKLFLMLGVTPMQVLVNRYANE